MMPKFKRKETLRKGKKRKGKKQKQRAWLVRTLMAKHKGQCVYCEKTMERSEITVDHIMPRSKGGLDVPENLTLACKDCNQEKGDGILIDSFIEEEEDETKQSNRKP